VRASAGAVLVAAVTLTLGGCGGGDDGEAEANCRAQAENAAEAAVIAEAYERGELGTQAEVQANFLPNDRVFDEQGMMLPYDELEPMTRARFDDYRASSKIPGEVQHQLADAREEVREAGYPGC
jgi:hypothetical protein